MGNASHMSIKKCLNNILICSKVTRYNKVLKLHVKSYHELKFEINTELHNFFLIVTNEY